MRRRCTSALRPAASPDRRRRQPDVGRDARHVARQRAARPHRRAAPASARVEKLLGPRLGAAGRHGHPVRDRPGRSRSRWSRHRRRRGRHLPLHRARRRPHRARPCLGARAHQHRGGPDPGRVTCNKVLFPQLEAALREVIDRGLADKIHPGEYAGCYYPRFIAGTSTLSNHAFGLALDINAVENQRGTVGQIDRGVVQIFQEWGFTWGGAGATPTRCTSS